MRGAGVQGTGHKCTHVEANSTSSSSSGSHPAYPFCRRMRLLIRAGKQATHFLLISHIAVALPSLLFTSLRVFPRFCLCSVPLCSWLRQAEREEVRERGDTLKVVAGTTHAANKTHIRSLEKHVQILALATRWRGEAARDERCARNRGGK